VKNDIAKAVITKPLQFPFFLLEKNKEKIHAASRTHLVLKIGETESPTPKPDCHK
jgi:hypothetical protein